MQLCCVDHHSIVVKVAHEPTSFEVEDLESAIFACCEEPLVISLEVKGSDIASMALKETFLVDGLAMTSLWDLIHFHLVVGRHAQVFAICCHCKLVDLRGGRVNRDLHRGQARVHVPELD